MSSEEEPSTGPVVRDRRRIDPDTGMVRGGRDTAAADRGAGPDEAGPVPAGPAGPAGPSRAGTGDEMTVKLAERTADLQRLQAEYANYRKRVERDRVAVREQALANVLSQLLPVLDDIGRAREHGELVGGFKQVAESLEAAVAKLGLTAYGDAGDPFDPTLHEALMHSYSGEVTEPTAVTILQPGYKVGDRILRPARVAVAEPGGDAADDPDPADAAAGADGGPADGTAEPGGEQAGEGEQAGPGAGPDARD
jgi:molecular chaperone GrpE